MTEERKLKVELDGGVIVHWDEELLDSLPDGESRPWHLHGEPQPEVSALRVLSARFGRNGALLVAALRPADADGHDAEWPRGLLRSSEGVQELHEVLLSTEYDGDGAARRIGLEMYDEPDGYAIRAAGDAKSFSASESDGWRREVVHLDFRLHGEDGVAVYEIWNRA
jgi:hypothetical protein